MTLNSKQGYVVGLPSSATALVVAGAGSGKTTLMVERVAKLSRIDRIPARSILGVTFTKKAAKEFKGRLEKISPVLGQANISTFHGASLDIMRKLFAMKGIVCPIALDKYTIIDDDDQKKLCKELIERDPPPDNLFKDNKACVGSTVRFINRCKEEMKRHKDLVFDLLKPTEVYASRIYQEYEARCAKESIFDFAEIVLYLVEGLRDYPHLRQIVSNQFQHILVDEFQDTNDVQAYLIELILNGKTSLTCVGDDDQSIYGWRGAKIEIMQEFERNHPGCIVVNLEQNYRSTGRILNAANNVIANNEKRLDKRLFTELGDGEPLELFTAPNNWQEGEEVSMRIKALIEDGVEPSQIAVLYRKNALSNALERGLRKCRVKYDVTGGKRFFDREEIRAALAYARLVVNPMDSMAFARVCSYPRRGIGKVAISAIAQQVQTRGLTYIEALAERKTKGCPELSSALSKLSSIYESSSLSDFFETLIKESGIREFFSNMNDKDKSESKLDNLDALLDTARHEGESTTLEEFLEEVATSVEVVQDDAQGSSVSLSTIHSAKGLEWEYVFIVGFTQGTFPAAQSLLLDDISEERRLAYVAITRAKKKLYFSYPLCGPDYSFLQPSQFIFETKDSDILSPTSEQEEESEYV